MGPFQSLQAWAVQGPSKGPGMQPCSPSILHSLGNLAVRKHASGGCVAWSQPLILSEPHFLHLITSCSKLITYQ